MNSPAHDTSPSQCIRDELLHHFPVSYSIDIWDYSLYFVEYQDCAFHPNIPQSKYDHRAIGERCTNALNQVHSFLNSHVLISDYYLSRSIVDHSVTFDYSQAVRLSSLCPAQTVPAPSADRHGLPRVPSSFDHWCSGGD